MTDAEFNAKQQETWDDLVASIGCAAGLASFLAGNCDTSPDEQNALEVLVSELKRIQRGFREYALADEQRAVAAPKLVAAKVARRGKVRR